MAELSQINNMIPAANNPGEAPSKLPYITPPTTSTTCHTLSNPVRIALHHTSLMHADTRDSLRNSSGALCLAQGERACNTRHSVFHNRLNHVLSHSGSHTRDTGNVPCPLFSLSRGAFLLLV